MIASAVAALGLPTTNSWPVDTVVSHRKAALEKCDEAVARADGPAFATARRTSSASCSPWHSPASRYRRPGLPTQRPPMGRTPLAARPGSVESYADQGSIGAPKTITTRPERIKEVDDEILSLGVTVLSPVGPASAP
jgi:hypothetical protein